MVPKSSNTLIYTKKIFKKKSQFYSIFTNKKKKSFSQCSFCPIWTAFEMKQFPTCWRRYWWWQQFDCLSFKFPTPMHNSSSFHWIKRKERRTRTRRAEEEIEEKKRPKLHWWKLNQFTWRKRAFFFLINTLLQTGKSLL